MMCFLRAVLFLSLVLSGLHTSIGSEGIDHHSGHRLHKHKTNRKHRATNEELHFDPKPFSKKIELNTPGKIHCKVAGGLSPTVQWFLNSEDALPEGVSSANGTLHVASAEKRHVGNYTCRATDGNHTITAEIHLDVVGTRPTASAEKRHVGNYTCRATDGNHTITAEIHLDVVVSPKVIEPLPDTEIHIGERQSALLNCRAIGDPLPTTHWVRNLTIINQSQDGVDIEGGVNATHARMLLLNNGSLWIRSARREDADRYACTAGSAAGMARTELVLTVHPEGYYAEGGSESGAGRAVLVAAGVAAGYMLLVLALMLYCRRRRRERRLRGEKIELEMAEGREKLVEEGDDKPKTNGAPNGKLPHDRDSEKVSEKIELEMAEGREKLVEGEDKPKTNGAPNGKLPHDRDSEKVSEKIELEMAEGREKLVEGEDKPKTNGAPNGKLPHDRDSGADTSEVSAASRVSRRGFEHLAAPRTLLSEQIPLGRGEFGEVSLARLDVSALKRARSAAASSAPRLRPVLVKALTSKDEAAGAEFRRQLELFGRVRHEGVARLLALCSDADPHLMILEHTDWGDLKTFLQATTAEQTAQFTGAGGASAAPLSPQHQALLASQLAHAATALATQRLTHRDIAARNCAISSALRLKLTMAAMSRGPDTAHYYKRHDQVIPLRWLPAEAALEGEYSAKSDAYMFAATVWEIYTKAELPFAKLNDNSVLERLKSGTLEWTVPGSMPDALAELLKRCWSNSPSERPQFEAICTEVDAVLQAVTSAETTQDDNP
ncbi:tyrosine-protein kinase-like otk [Cydia fagiglandana]|uniref:tyrosine-protein kinase-like otk n=1 Tax=Cydia fagiglandana TaxID=1458189 RepID=UPI002FEE2785